jgi:AAHS family benzoate transporter-like MFS transporter
MCAAGVAWRGLRPSGGIGGPMLGSALIGAGFQLDAIFYILAALGGLGVALTLGVPMARAQGGGALSAGR